MAKKQAKNERTKAEKKADEKLKAEQKADAFAFVDLSNENIVPFTIQTTKKVNGIMVTGNVSTYHYFRTLTDREQLNLFSLFGKVSKVFKQSKLGKLVANKKTQEEITIPEYGDATFDFYEKGEDQIIEIAEVYNKVVVKVDGMLIDEVYNLEEIKKAILVMTKFRIVVDFINIMGGTGFLSE